MGTSQVQGATGGGAPMKMPASTVAGASGAPMKTPHQHGNVAGASGNATQAGGPTGAAAGASAIGGGTDLAAALQSLVAVLKTLAEAVSKLSSGAAGGGAGGCNMAGMGHVMGVQGGPAAEGEFVAVPAPLATSGSEDDAYEQRVLELINQERAKAGLAPVRYNATLDRAAEKHNAQMGKTGRMAHDGIGDGDPGERIRAEGFRDAWGENVATGQTSPEQVVREWMNSPEHRRNIMDPNFRQMGVAYATAADGRTYWAQEFGA